MTDLIIFLLATTGVTMIYIRSTLLMPLRDKVNLFRTWSKKQTGAIGFVFRRITWFLISITTCELCFSVWSGFVLYPIVFNDYSIKFIIFGFVSSGFVYLYTKLVNRLEGTSCKK